MRHSGWTQVSVTRSMEQFAHTFDVEFNDHWLADQQSIPIRPGNACEVRLKDITKPESSGALVISGYVDDADVSQSATDFSI